jgi:hypothetical protein
MKKTASGLLLLLVSAFAAAQISHPPRRPTASANYSCKINNAPLSEADIAVLKHDYSRARKIYMDQWAKNPTDLAAQADATSMLVEERHYEDALKEATDFVQGHQDSSIAQWILSLAQWSVGDSTAALDSIALAISLDPCNYRALAHAALMEQAAGQGVSAAQHAQLAHQLSPLRVRGIWPETRASSEQSSAYDMLASNTPDDAAEQKAHLLAAAEAARQRLASQCTVTAGRPRIRIPLHQMNPNYDIFMSLIGMDAKVNGHSKTVMLSSDDTIVLAKSAAQELGLSDQVPLYTRVATGEQSPKTSFVRIADLKIGDLEYKNCPAIVINDDNVHGMRVPLSFFGDFLTTVDTPRLEIDVSALPQAAPGAETHWSHVAMDGVEARSINGGAWPNQMASRPAELEGWTPIFREDSTILVPTQIDPLHKRLFRLDIYLAHGGVSSQTAKDALPVTKYPNADKQFQKMLGGAKYALQFGGIFQAIDTWNVSSDRAYGGTLGVEALKKVRYTLDLRDNLALFQRSQQR